MHITVVIDGAKIELNAHITREEERKARQSFRKMR
jgi:hypothetical protein